MTITHWSVTAETLSRTTVQLRPLFVDLLELQTVVYLTRLLLPTKKGGGLEPLADG